MQTLKYRLLHGWTFMRVLYVVMGGIILGESILQKEWIGMALGVYFAAMGLFAFGCASGNCAFTPSFPKKMEEK